MLWPSLLFAVFALLSAAGVYLILANHRSRSAGLLGALLTLFLFAGIYAGVLALLREGGLV